MKVCIPMKSSMVGNHFGKAPEFSMFLIEENSIISREIVKNPGRENALVVKLMPEQGVTHIITGAMGSKARAMMQEHQIVVISGVLGSIDTAVLRFIRGELVSTDAPCADEHKCGL
jgi:predicted Fe-Mo cluster-binding NifX family protein